jgi:GTPase
MVLREAVAWRNPPTAKASGKKGRVYYGTQAASRPPTFVLFVNDPKAFTEYYRQYVERQIRENIGFPGTPLRLYWRGKDRAAEARRTVHVKPHTG